MKAKRQRKIIELISEYQIETQEELAKMLIDSGFRVTQATVSRDIRELNLQEVADKNMLYRLLRQLQMTASICVY